MKKAPPLTRRAVGTLLLVQESLDRDITAAVRTHIAKASAEAAERHSNERRAATLALLLLGAKAMATDVRLAIVDGRQRARAAARGRLSAELAAAGVIIGAHEWQPGHRSDEDDVHATSSADSLASQWRQLAIAAVLMSRRKETPPAHAIAATGDRMAYRIDRTAGSEVAQAYNDEHKRSLDELVGFDRRFRDSELAERIVSRLGRQWQALIDACHMCAPHDGEIVGIGESFAGNDEPGSMHPRCRCVDVIVPLDAALRVAA